MSKRKADKEEEEVEGERKTKKEKKEKKEKKVKKEKKEKKENKEKEAQEAEVETVAVAEIGVDGIGKAPRKKSLPPGYKCFACGALEQHAIYECPMKKVRRDPSYVSSLSLSVPF